ncbi:MAG: chorismate-binding protein, partial [Gammaproteobacteria bacterium]|nr:chorismate-binding protein [Gammaproteobacteria bacterium]
RLGVKANADTGPDAVTALKYGAIAYIGFDRTMDSNIAIRTLSRYGDHIDYWAGGGIVADSDPEMEYQESLQKGILLQQLLEQFHQ